MCRQAGGPGGPLPEWVVIIGRAHVSCGSRHAIADCMLCATRRHGGARLSAPACPAPLDATARPVYRLLRQQPSCRRSSSVSVSVLPLLRSFRQHGSRLPPGALARAHTTVPKGSGESWAAVEAGRAPCSCVPDAKVSHGRGALRSASSGREQGEGAAHDDARTLGLRYPRPPCS